MKKPISAMRAADWRALIGKRITLNSRSDPYRGYYDTRTGVLEEFHRKNLCVSGDWLYTTNWATVEVLEETEKP